MIDNIKTNTNFIQKALGQNVNLNDGVGTVISSHDIFSILVVGDGCILVSAIDKTPSDIGLYQLALTINTTLAFEARGSICRDPESEQMVYVHKIAFHDDETLSMDFQHQIDLYAATRLWISDSLMLGDINIEEKGSFFAHA